jgi:hypothetical protein
MASDDATEAAAALQQRVANKMAALQAVEKNADEAHARMHTIILLLEEEQASAATQEAESAAATLQLASTIASSSSAPPPQSSRGDTDVVAMLHMQACGV